MILVMGLYSIMGRILVLYSNSIFKVCVLIILI